MHPVLFRIFSFPIHSYGFMLAVSFLLGIWIASVRAKRAGLDPAVIADVGFWVILSAIVGARAYYAVLHFEEFRGDPFSIINPFHGGVVGIGGLVMYGGFIGAVLASILYFSVKKRPFSAVCRRLRPFHRPWRGADEDRLFFKRLLLRLGCGALRRNIPDVKCRRALSA